MCIQGKPAEISGDVNERCTPSTVLAVSCLEFSETPKLPARSWKDFSNLMRGGPDPDETPSSEHGESAPETVQVLAGGTRPTQHHPTTSHVLLGTWIVCDLLIIAPRSMRSRNQAQHPGCGSQNRLIAAGRTWNPGIERRCRNSGLLLGALQAIATALG